MAMRVMRSMVHRSRGSVVVVSAVRRRKAGSRERQARKGGSEGLDGLVHVTPSLSSFVVVRISRLHTVRYVCCGFLTKFPVQALGVV